MNHEPVKHASTFTRSRMKLQASRRLSFAERGFGCAAIAGAHIDVVLPNGLTRQYSLINGRRNRWLSRCGETRREEPWGLAVHARSAACRYAAHVSAPRNTSRCAKRTAQRVRRGGIGITPIVSMIERLVALGQSWNSYMPSVAPRCGVSRSPHRGSRRAHVHVDDEVGGASASVRTCRTFPRTPTSTVADRRRCSMLSRGNCRARQTRVHVERFAPHRWNRRGTFVVELARSKMSVTVADGDRSLLRCATRASRRCLRAKKASAVRARPRTRWTSRSSRQRVERN